jgi:hypothetical protein
MAFGKTNICRLLLSLWSEKHESTDLPDHPMISLSPANTAVGRSHHNRERMAWPKWSTRRNWLYKVLGDKQENVRVDKLKRAINRAHTHLRNVIHA